MNETRRIILKSLVVGDTEDVQLYAEQAAYDWLQTDMGKWCQENVTDVLLESHVDYDSFYPVYLITGQLTESQYAYFLMKYKGE